MAIKLIANYSKRLGLPGFSSHQYSVTVETELNTTDDIPTASARLYDLLQADVDQQIRKRGFIPPKEYGMEGPDDHPSGEAPPTNVTTVANWQRGSAWKCSDKQKDLILKLVEEHQLDKTNVEALAVERFGKGVRLLNKVEASGLIDELLDTHGSGSGSPTNSRNNGRAYRRSSGKDAA